MHRFIEPMTDFGFKKIFASPENSTILINLLNTLLDRKDDDCIEDIEYLSPEKLGRSRDDRVAIFDLYCRSHRGEYFIV